MVRTEIFFDETKTVKKAKIMKESHAYRGHASTYNVEISNSFNDKLQIKDTKSVIRNTLKDLLSKLKVFKFVKTLVLEFKNKERDDETKYSTFY